MDIQALVRLMPVGAAIVECILDLVRPCARARAIPN